MHDSADINVTEILTEIIREIVSAVPVFSHIDADRTLVCISSNRRGSRGGTYAKLVPLRFENGSKILRFRGRHYSLPEITLNGIDYLYIVYFYMPRFFDLPAQEKMRVIFHELYHISPQFNGDIRRMGKVKAAHGHSKKHFDQHFSHDLEEFIRVCRDRSWMDFLHLKTSVIFKRYRNVLGRRMKNPKPAILD